MAHFAHAEWLLHWILLQTQFAFEWDNGNSTKSVLKHRITCKEAEEVFEQIEAIRVLGEQVKPATDEPRFGLLGLTQAGRHLFVCFTLRGTGLRIISIREMNQKERRLYVQLCEE